MQRRLLIIALIVGAICLGACSRKSPSDEIFGTWKVCGVLPQEKAYQNNLDEKKIISGDAYRETFGENVPDSSINITEDGVKEYLDLNGKGSEVTGWEKDEQSGQWTMTLEITRLAGEEKPLENPLVMTFTYTLRDGYLLEESHLDSEDEAESIVNVYKRAG